VKATFHEREYELAVNLELVASSGMFFAPMVCTLRRRLRRGRAVPRLIDKAAVLCTRLARNQPLPDGNKRVAYLALLEFLWRNDVEWVSPSVDDTVATIERVAAGTISEREFADWLRATRA
jgi:prophage maintenance system killer protein